MMRTAIAALVAVAGLALTTVRADEKPIALDKLPKAVTDGLKKAYSKAEMKEAVIDDDGKGKVSYEVVIVDAKQNITVTLSSEGTITLLEKEIPLKSVPKIVMDAVMAKYPKAKATKSEEIFAVKDGKETFEKFEVIIDNEGKTGIEVYVSKDGKIVQ